jgi:hypothetical protein
LFNQSLLDIDQFLLNIDDVALAFDRSAEGIEVLAFQRRHAVFVGLLERLLERSELRGCGLSWAQQFDQCFSWIIVDDQALFFVATLARRFLLCFWS